MADFSVIVSALDKAHVDGSNVKMLYTNVVDHGNFGHKEQEHVRSLEAASVWREDFI